MVLIDTGVWSLALRRNHLHLNEKETLIKAALFELMEYGRARLIGQIRQELLSGIREEDAFVRVRDKMRAYPDVRLDEADFENAAVASNKCKSAGIAGANVDFLICSVAVRRQWPIFSTDKDFEHYAKVLPIKLFRPRI